MSGVVADMNAISLDLPGFGSSPVPESAWGAADYARCVADVLDELDRPCVVVGYSFGGRVAVNLAAQRPDAIEAVVLTGVPLIRATSGKKPALGFRLIKRAHRLGLIGDERMENERRKRGSADYRAATGTMRDVFVKVVNESYEEQLAAMKMPVEMVWGENDTEAPLSQARQALDLLGRANLTVVPGGDHWLVAADPTPVRNAIQRVLRGETA